MMTLVALVDFFAIKVVFQIVKCTTITNTTSALTIMNILFH